MTPYSVTDPLTPRSFGDHYSRISLINPRNKLVLRLESDPALQQKIMNTLADMGQTKFINLVSKPEHSTICMALYAGDGIVTKISPADYTAYEKLPRVLPPFKKLVIENEGNGGPIAIENYPYSANNGLDQKSIDALQIELRKLGMRFTDQDDRPDNICRLPDGALAVLDGNAVEYYEPRDRNLKQQDQDYWLFKIKLLYPDLYREGYQYRQSAKTDFRIMPPPSTLTTLPTEAPARSSWLRRKLSSLHLVD